MKTGIIAPNIMLPKDADMRYFATIACDQFTSEPDYWNELEKFVGGNPSTLNMVLPEIYLDGTEDKRIEKINENIKNNLKNGVFKTLEKGFVLTIRSTPYVEKRIGLVGAVDLENYEYSKKNNALIRATEGTIEERIPPRLKIRKNAQVEFPHVMVLFDDEKREITEKLYERKDTLEKLYDFDLNMNGGHIEGYFVADYEGVLASFEKLLDSDRLIAKYGTNDLFAFAVGDGNHSLATAKTHWNKVKETLSDCEKENHPARYALVEFVNVYDEGIYFEPIFRFISGVDREKFIAELTSKVNFACEIIDGEKKIEIKGEKNIPSAIISVDEFIREYIAKNGGIVDYVHGVDNLTNLVKAKEDTVGVLFEKLDKSELFKYVSKTGAFPRKTFSMGEGIEKRYYLEGRKIVK